MFITEFHTFERHGMLRKKSKVKYNVSFLGRELKMINYKYEPPFRNRFILKVGKMGNGP